VQRVRHPAEAIPGSCASVAARLCFLSIPDSDITNRLTKWHLHAVLSAFADNNQE